MIYVVCISVCLFSVSMSVCVIHQPAMHIYIYICDAVSVSKIVRVIRQPRGNMLLIGIGGSGRQSVSRLSSYICECVTFQIEVTKHYRKMEFRDGQCSGVSGCSHRLRFMAWPQ